MPEEKEEKLVGEITHYFGKIGVAVVKVSDTLKVGDEIKIVSKTGEEFTQKVESMQIEHENIKEAKAGDLIGLKVIQKAKEGSKVYKVQ